MLKKMFILFASFLIFGQAIYSYEEPPKTLLERKEVQEKREKIKKAKIKKTISYKYNIADGKETDLKVKIIEQEFNQAGQLIYLSTFFVNGLKNRYEYKYDKNLSRVEEKIYDGVGNVVKKNEFTYDDEGKILGIKSYGQKGELLESVTYNYDNGKRLITEKRYKEGKILYLTTDYEYNNDYDLFYPIIIERLDDQNHLVSKTENQIGGNGKVIESITYDKDGKRISKVQYEHNSDGNVTKMSNYDKDNALTSYEIYSYTKDGVLSEIRVFDASKKLTTLIKNEFENFNEKNVKTKKEKSTGLSG